MADMSRQTDGRGALRSWAARLFAPATTPWISRILILLCITNFLGLMFQGDDRSWSSVRRFGHLPADEIWRGDYWALVTTAFVHFELWHLAFNLFWLWRLGSWLECTIGSLRYLGFVVLAAAVSSSCQLAVSDTTGIGASGVGYAIFGFMWIARRQYPHFETVLDDRIVQLFVIWLFGCMAATYLDLVSIANAAHVGGLLFGVALAGSLPHAPYRIASRVGLAIVLATAFVPLFWCPWSTDWHRVKAYDAHVAKRYGAAIDHYSQVLRRDAYDAWSLRNRSRAYYAIGDAEQAESDWHRAHEIDPSDSD